jgi:hypothetical protein
VTTPSLTTATLSRRGSDVVATWTVNGDLPSTGTCQLSAKLVGGPNGPIHSFAVKFLDGRLIAFYVFDHVAAQQHNLSGTPQRVAAKWTAVFPVGELDVADSGRWSAVLTIGPTDVSTVDGEL